MRYGLLLHGIGMGFALIASDKSEVDVEESGLASLLKALQRIGPASTPAAPTQPDAPEPTRATDARSRP